MLKVAYYSFTRVQEVYTINVQIYFFIFFCINILITIKNPYMRPLLLQITVCEVKGALKGHETGRPCTIRGPGNELEKCVLRETEISPLSTKEHPYKEKKNFKRQFFHD